MKLCAFSVSLAVKDIVASRAFYEKLGFHVFGGDQSQNWLILKNEDETLIRLFQGMFAGNITSSFISPSNKTVRGYLRLKPS